MTITKEAMMKALSGIKYPGYNKNIVSFGLIKDIIVQKKDITIHIIFSTENEERRQAIVQNIRDNLAGYKLDSVQFEISERQQSARAAEAEISKQEIPGVKHIIATASGKGGVGKSTVAVNLAYWIAKSGYKTGLLDADIYGPSIPLMLGINEQPKADEDKIIPIEKYGLKVMSIGFFLSRHDDALIWRGPMVMKAVEQLLFDVQWGELDFLVVDLPPGTGDAQLTLAQRVPISGALVVTTPQDVALIDARKGVNMFARVGIPVLGIIENMSYFICPHCHERTDIFSHGGGKITSLQMRVPFLGEIPIIPSLRAQSDEGIPSGLSEEENEQSRYFEQLAAKVSSFFIKK